ncbi:MAG: TadE family type IV pilus minor pilin [Carbonactinosporaceae bacterium]
MGLVKRSGRDRPRASRGDTGLVTAETAAALPALVLVLAIALWGVAAAGAQLRCIDAARAGARAVARGEDRDSSRAAAASAAPAGAAIRIHSSGALVSVTVSARVGPPGPALSLLPGVTVRGDASAAHEESW